MLRVQRFIGSEICRFQVSVFSNRLRRNEELKPDTQNLIVTLNPEPSNPNEP